MRCFMAPPSSDGAGPTSQNLVLTEDTFLLDDLHDLIDIDGAISIHPRALWREFKFEADRHTPICLGRALTDARIKQVKYPAEPL